MDKLVAGEGARIGHLTFVKGLSSVRIGVSGTLGSLNWVTAAKIGKTRHFRQEAERDPSLIIGPHAAVTARHLIDCTDAVRIGQFSTFAGWGSQILTHSIDLKNGRQSCAPVVIGSYCFVGTRVVLLKGSSLPDYSVLAAGSVLGRAMDQPGMLYSGVPAVAVRPLDRDGKYFRREIGFVV